MALVECTELLLLKPQAVAQPKHGLFAPVTSPLPSWVGREIRLQKEGAFPMTQNRALQLLYDLRYLNIVLTARGEEVKSGRGKQDSRYAHPSGLSQCCFCRGHTAPNQEATKRQPLVVH